MHDRLMFQKHHPSENNRAALCNAPRLVSVKRQLSPETVCSSVDNLLET